MVSTTCLACGIEFNTVPAKLREGQSKYCSLACATSSKGYRRQVRAALPGTIAQIVARSGVTAETVRDQLVGLQRRGEVHAARLEPVPADQRGRGEPAHAIVYVAGPGNDPNMPKTTRAALAYFYRRALLDEMPGTQTEIALRSGHCQGSVSRMVAELHADGKCHIVRWRRGRAGASVPVYKAGEGVDSKCHIVPFTSAERCARHLKKLARTGQLAQLRARSAAEQRGVTLRKHGDRLVNILSGHARVAIKEEA